MTQPTHTLRNHHMAESKLNQAIRKREQAQTALDLAIETGQDTSAARGKLESARQEVERLEALDEQRREAEREARNEQALALADEVRAEIQAAQERINAQAQRPELLALDARIAAAVLEARAAHDQALASVQQARDRQAALVERLADLRARRQAIVQRRAAGEHHEEDGPALALLDADIEGLGGLIEAAQAETLAREQDVRGTSEVSASAERRWSGEVYRYRCAALRKSADGHERALALVAEEMMHKVGSDGPQRYSPAIKGFCDALHAVQWSPYR